MADIVNLLAAAAGAGPTAETDPNFNQTVLLLHGDGSDGAQNNTFLDSSSNGFTITRSGNTTQGTFSPFSQSDGRWSIDSQRAAATQIAIADDASLRIGTNEFAIEAMVYMRDFDEISVILSKTQGGMAAGDWSFEFNTSGQLRFGYSTSYLTYGTALNLNQWYHLAVTRNASNLVEIWVDGVSVTSATISTDLDSTDNVKIAENSGGDREANFIISNLRFVNGSSYTPTVPTTPLTAITNTVLLAAQSNRFIDNSTYGHTLSVAGSVSISPYSPFAPTAAYDASVNGGSGYFDGSGDNLSGIGSVSDFNFIHNTTGLCTIECWVYWDGVAGTSDFILANRRNSSNVGVVLGYNGGTGKWIFEVAKGSTGNLVVAAYSSADAVANQWVHLCVEWDYVSDSGTWYINGAVDSTFSRINTASTSNANDSLYIGRNRSDTSFMWQGYISNLRISNSIVYGGAFTPSTEPLTTTSQSATNVELLLNFTNAGIYNNALSGGVNLETVGNAQIDTTTKVFGTGSIELDGSGDTLLVGTQPDWRFLHDGSSFTIEMWFYTGSTANQYLASTTATTANRGFRFSMNNTSTRNIEFVFYRDVSGSNLAAISAGSVWNLNTWHHAAAVYDSSTTTLTVYIDGSSVATANASSFAFNQLDPEHTLAIGRSQNVVGNYFNGFIDDIRVTRGIARTITVPTKAFPDL